MKKGWHADETQLTIHRFTFTLMAEKKQEPLFYFTTCVAVAGFTFE
ncbi:MAG: hypothetical protein ABF868_03355 [Sporolactobacillus sp.]